jgi:transcriptional regulator with XRE-family HTH domain
MNAKGMTLQNLADEAGVFVGTVRDFLSGGRWPRARSLWKIEDALGWQRGRIATIARDYEVITEDGPRNRSPLLAELLADIDRLNENNQLRILVQVRDLLEEQDRRTAM